MEQQVGFSEMKFAGKRKLTRPDKLLAQIVTAAWSTLRSPLRQPFRTFCKPPDCCTVKRNVVGMRAQKNPGTSHEKSTRGFEQLDQPVENNYAAIGWASAR